MRLVVSLVNKAYKLEPVRTKEEYQRMTAILDCFEKDGQQMLFMLPEGWLTFYGHDLTEFVKSRTTKKTREYVSPRIDYRDDMTLYWFTLKNDDEFYEMSRLTKSIQFLCVVVDNNCDPKDYCFHIDLGEFGKLVILEKNQGDFLNNVLPKIQQIIPDIVQEQEAEGEEY